MKYRIVEYPGRGFMAQKKKLVGQPWSNLQDVCAVDIEFSLGAITRHQEGKSNPKVVWEDEV